MFSLLLALLNNAYFISYIKSKTFDLPLNAKEERFYLEKKEQGDKNARDLLIEKNLRLAAHIAKKYNNNKDLQEDLISIGTIGLIKAIDSYSLDKKTKLATYASKCIENEILMHFRSQKKYGPTVSLNDAIGHDKEGNEINLIDVIKDKNVDLFETLDLKNNINLLKKYLRLLNKREKEIIIKRYGLNNTKDMTQKEIADELKISRSYVSRIEKRALTKMLTEFIKNKNID